MYFYFFFLLNIFIAFPNADNSIAKVKDRWAHIRDEYLKRQRLNKKGSGSGFTDIEDEPLDEMLSGLNDVYELKQYVISYLIMLYLCSCSCLLVIVCKNDVRISRHTFN